MALDKRTPMAYVQCITKRRITVVEIKQFTVRAKGRMTAEEVDTVTDMIAADPLCGDLIRGTGGVRKARFAVRHRGKRGGVRVVYYHYDESVPVFLLTAFAKGEKDNLTKAERNTLAKLGRILHDSYGE